MAKDTSGVISKKDKAQEELLTEDDLVLRDESDEIIDNLKKQIQSLQARLDESGDGRDTPPAAASGGGAGGDELIGAWNQGLAPHLASRLQVPAEELTQRLERMIDRVDDPELRDELERCRDLAYCLFDTFRKISSSHDLLTESLTSPKVEVDTDDFCLILEHSLPTSGFSIPVQKAQPLPRRIAFASRPAIRIAQSLAELAAVLFGRPLHIEVGPVAPTEKGDEPDRLILRVISGTALSGDANENVSTFAMRQGVTATTIVDLLYVEKIIELQNGLFSFYRKDGKIHGFEAQLPFDSIEDE